ncbi:MAG TPA: c-type cytochrome [Pirellulales bacterium]
MIRHLALFGCFASLLAVAISLGLKTHAAIADDDGANVPLQEAPTGQTVLTFPEGPLGDTIKLGEQLVARTATHPLTKPFVGNQLNCTSCHLKNGTDLKAASFIGVATAYPAWSAREKRVITLEDRVLNCFMRSCDGVRPPLGGKVAVAITAYITWLSNGQAIRQNGLAPLGPRAVRPLRLKANQADRKRGAKLYADRCASCHGDDGAGDEDGPPVWGERSYNHGAGFAKDDHLAAWLKVAMPLDEADFTEQEAIDVAAFVNSNPRPEFVLNNHLPSADQLGEYNAEASDNRR